MHTQYTRQSEVVLEFPRKNSSSPSEYLCLEMSSDSNFNFCYVRLPVEQNRENTYFINSSIHSFIPNTGSIFIRLFFTRTEQLQTWTLYLLTHTIAFWLQLLSRSSQKKVSIFLSTLKILPQIKLRTQPFYQAQMVAIVPFLRVIHVGIYWTTASRGM